MSELRRSAALCRGNLGLHLLENPANTFSFVGSVPFVLAYEQVDGSDITEQQAKQIRQFGPGLFKSSIRSRGWTSREQAVAFAASRGFSVQGHEAVLLNPPTTNSKP
jgi:hypothetical protein